MSLVCLDTQIIQWGVMKRASDSQSQQFISRASDFIVWLDKQKVDIILPSLIVGELLVPIAPHDHAQVLAKLSTDWMIVDYDIRAARLFAEMRYDSAIKQIMDDIRNRNPFATRKQLIADVLIIATAIVNGAEKIYSHNHDFLALAKRYVSAENFLDVQIQTSFLGEDQTE